ncbi:hypothetical protein FOL47_005277 [Perkinsus chesapeaki]|uniref:Uncharacterized protein n=1 Tax=Perkinsus chesapeaki TaxID=330153 RepID=A0A7J6LY03_PERCH|nr:hypothetical protein FOL47_005277 [Perkinsus chesapeaki]
MAVSQLLVLSALLSATQTFGNEILSDDPVVRALNPVNFTFPIGCGPTTRIGNLTFCITGAVDLGRLWILDFNLHMFDVFLNRSVTFGMGFEIQDTGVANRLNANTGGCATIIKQDFFPDWKPDEAVGALTICTDGGETKFDNATQEFVAHFGLSGDFDLYSKGRQVMRTPFATPFSYAILGQDFDVRFNSSVLATGGDEHANSSVNFTMAMSTLGGSVLNWHLFSGLDLRVWWEGRGEYNLTIPFIDQDFQVPLR